MKIENVHAIVCEAEGCRAALGREPDEDDAGLVRRARESGWVMIYGDFGWEDWCPAHPPRAKENV